jgi:hypothetical protein
LSNAIGHKSLKMIQIKLLYLGHENVGGIDIRAPGYLGEGWICKGVFTFTSCCQENASLTIIVSERYVNKNLKRKLNINGICSLIERSKRVQSKQVN